MRWHIFEALSFMFGSGTHYEHYKFGLMVLIILVNLTFNIFKKNINFIGKEVVEKIKEQKLKKKLN